MVRENQDALVRRVVKLGAESTGSHTLHSSNGKNVSKNVEELEALAAQGMEYIGVHNTAIEDSEPVYVREIAEFQYKCLNQILSNEAALLLMDHRLE